MPAVRVLAKCKTDPNERWELRICFRFHCNTLLCLHACMHLHLQFNFLATFLPCNKGNHNNILFLHFCALMIMCRINLLDIPQQNMNISSQFWNKMRRSIFSVYKLFQVQVCLLLSFIYLLRRIRFFCDLPWPILKWRKKIRKSLKLSIARGHATHPSEYHNVKSHQLFLTEKIQLDLMWLLPLARCLREILSKL